MNTTTYAHGVSRVNVGESEMRYQTDGARTWHRTIVCHGGGQSFSLCLSSDTKGGLQLHFHPQDLDACLAGLSVDQLDSLANAVRAERQGRDNVIAGEAWQRLHPRDCDGGLAAPDHAVPVGAEGGPRPPF